MSEINKYEIDWRAWPDGARIQSSGTEVEYGENEEEAKRRFSQRFPGVDWIDDIRKLPPQNSVIGNTRENKNP